MDLEAHRFNVPPGRHSLLHPGLRPAPHCLLPSEEMQDQATLRCRETSGIDLCAERCCREARVKAKVCSCLVPQKMGDDWEGAPSSPHFGGQSGELSWLFQLVLLRGAGMKTPRRFYAPRIPLKQIRERILPFIFHRTREKMQGIKRNFLLFKRGIRKTIFISKVC